MLKKLISCTVEGKVKESFAIVKKSEDPLGNFRRSMVDMIVEKQMLEKKDLEQLLEGSKRSNKEDEVNARSGFTIKRRRLSKRCGCKASISFKFFSEAGIPGYIIQEFNEVHYHYMVESEHQQFMTLNRKLDDVHHKFILDYSKANIGPTLTFKVLKEILGGFELVRCNVGDIRNTSRDIKAYANSCDVQMVLDDMAKKKEPSDAFTYHYEVNAANQLVALFWCDGLIKRNWHMFGDIVAFDSTYNTNRYCMIFTPFTGKDNHGKSVTFAAGLVCNEKTGAFGWLFKHFVECMGVAPKMIVTDQDLGMRSAIQEVLVGTQHRWCMWHIMHKLASKVPGRLLRDEDFKKEFNACDWSDLLEPDEFEEECNGVIEHYELEDRNARTKLDYNDATAVPILATKLAFEKHAATIYTDSMFRKIQEEIVDGNDRCRVLGFSSTDMVDTYKLGDSRRNSYSVRHDKTDDSYSYDCKLFGRQGYLCCHIFFLFRNNEVKKIPEKYYDSRWMKTPLSKVVHGLFGVTVDTRSTVDDRQTVSNKGISFFYGFLRRIETDIDVLRAFVGGLEELGNEYVHYSTE
ncbi:protein FAR1-RELATED SEQUENCE 7-like [Salvia hispanica]|uniref:protein FAR1-RELATED SEQUENCE 7-like n=1 Tax=Salvia hispanica TaxID=49212 RepID=UPI0020097593|nr:protein FAR1-RELATED SEQUENCE 7-like [Salvia hispanica]